MRCSYQWQSCTYVPMRACFCTSMSDRQTANALNPDTAYFKIFDVFFFTRDLNLIFHETGVLRGRGSHSQQVFDIRARLGLG